LVMRLLRDKFPNTKFDFTNAGIASTCSHTGAFRMPRDVLAAEPDLLLVEFAVNDDQDASHSHQQALRGMEGIVRAARLANPSVDIVMIHFVNPSMLADTQAGKVPISIAAHEQVASHYGIPTCNIARALAERIDGGAMTWEGYGGVHPGPKGNQLAADLVGELLNQAWAHPPKADAPGPRSSLPEPIDSNSFSHGRFLAEDQVDLGKGWQRSVPHWDSIPGTLRKRFAGVPMVHTDQPSAQLSLHFRGTAIGLYVLAGPDAGQVEYSVDGGPWKRVELLHRFSHKLHYPRTVMLESALQPGEHSVRIRSAAPSPEASSAKDSGGTAIRILHFVAS